MDLHLVRENSYINRVGENMKRSQEHPVIMYLLRRARRLHCSNDIGFCLALNRFKEMMYSGEIPNYP
jgi:hypothetical protein